MDTNKKGDKSVAIIMAKLVVKQLERCQSGLSYQFAKLMWVKPPRVRIPVSPPEKGLTISLARAIMVIE